MAESGEEVVITNVSIMEKGDGLFWRDGLFWDQQRMKPIRSYSLYFDTDYGGDIDEKFLGDNIFSLFVNSPIEKFLREGEWKINFSIVEESVNGLGSYVWFGYEIDFSGGIEWTSKMLFEKKGG